MTPGCDKSTSHVTTPAGIAWVNTACFGPPPDWGFGDEARVDPTLRSQGINNWDFAVFKNTNFGPDNRLGIQFRAEFFNTFNRVQFGPPNTACCTSNNASFGLVSSQLNTPRLIQLGLKFLF